MRALISNGMLRGQRHKLWCMGPMFRHERPQKGRYRQFNQINLEAVGFPGPDVDAELIALTARLWRRLGIERVRLEINSLGTPESRRVYREKLIAYFRAHESALDSDSRRRLEGNPLRILDSKNPEMSAIIAGAPLLTDHLDPESREHFDALCAALESIGIPYRVNPRLVRGLDYYTPHACSSGSPTHSGPRMPYAPAAATMGSSPSSAASRRPASASRWGWSGSWSCSCRRARFRRRLPRTSTWW